MLIAYSAQNQDATVMPSYVVLASFATELYLKTIFYIEAREEATKLKEHSLADIYQKLGQDSRDSVRGYFGYLLPRYFPAPSSVPKVWAFAESNAFTTDFDYTLQMMSDAFLTFRYWYQKGSNAPYPWAAQVVRHAVNRRIIDLVPGLRGDQRSLSLVDEPRLTSAQSLDLSIYKSEDFAVRQPPYEAAYFAAEGNWAAAEVLYYQLHEGAGFVLYSYAMLACLAVELYLKSLIHFEDKAHVRTGKRKVKTKSLCELYEMLSREDRRAIRQYFNSQSRKFAPRPISDLVPGDLGSLARDKVITYDFDGTLGWISEAFADFRYAFEHPHCLVVLPTYQTLRDALRKRILELAPELDKLQA